MNLSEYAIVSDFDGTITLSDTNDTIFYHNGNEKNRVIEERFIAGFLDYKSTISQHFEAKPLDFKQYFSYLDTHILIDPWFGAFLARVRENNLPFFIVSGGFRPAINHLLKDFELQAESIFSNDLVFDGRLFPLFAHCIASCPVEIGPCGNCKKICIEAIINQTGKKILFIGDGFTDRCAVKISDYVFAKDSLVDYCVTQGLEHRAYSNFDDISAAIFDGN